MVEETAAPDKEAAPEPKKSKGFLWIIIVAAVVALVGGGVTRFLLHSNKPTEAAPEETAPKYTVHLDSFTVNLADPQESHFLRISIDVGMGKPLKASKEGESDFPTARVRDAILPVLASGKGDVLVTPQGKEELKKAILSALQQKVPEIGAQDIYFTEFLVQR
jgi:flagellar basal body-associated protein FliL